MGTSDKIPTQAAKPRATEPARPHPAPGVGCGVTSVSSTHVLCPNVFLGIKPMCSLYLFTCSRAQRCPGGMGSPRTRWRWQPAPAGVNHPVVTTSAVPLGFKTFSPKFT